MNKWTDKQTDPVSFSSRSLKGLFYLLMFSAKDRDPKEDVHRDLPQKVLDNIIKTQQKKPQANQHYKLFQKGDFLNEHS